MIPVNTITFTGNEKKYLAQCIDEGWVSSEGPFVKRLEESFATHHKQEHGIAVCNGTAALEIALKALGLGPGDEVILPTFTIISCAAAVIRCGATPVLVDCDNQTWNMSPQSVLEAVTERTRAILIVHIYGLPVNMAPIIEFARARNIAVIEDCAELLGQSYHGSPVGSFGDIATFSFYANKHVTSGEGGMIVCSQNDLAERCRSLRNLCFQAERRFVHEELGWNFRISNLQAAVGLAQFECLEKTIARKTEIGKLYNELLARTSALQLPLANTPYASNIYWVYGVVLNDDVPFDAIEAAHRLRARGVDTRPFFWSMHEQPVFHRMGLFRDLNFPNSERIARRGFYIPSGPGLDDSSIEKVAEVLNGIF